ncbi:MAG: hypothetical protein FRX49_12869 [Trebouxia sp. A1-2]|nr:MAG: hypothetical protein FRX49_12869 [Trebouxia sp. A1-2]
MGVQGVADMASGKGRAGGLPGRRPLNIALHHEKKLHLCDPAQELEQSPYAACVLSGGEKHAFQAEPAGLAEGVEEARDVRHAVHAEPAGLAEADE